MADNEPKLPFTDQDMRDSEQYSLDLALVSQPQPKPTPDYVKPCGNLGFCYCPKCNPK